MLTLPDVLTRTLQDALVCSYTSLTRDGRPITWPVVPYIGERGTLDVTTGLTYPDKAERARRDPRVALLYTGDPVIVLVQGRATVRDADLQANTDRYVRESLAKTPAGFAGLPWFLVKRLTWYFARIYVEVTPERLTWWPGGDLTRAPQTWVCPPGVAVPPSDPAPTGPRLPGRSTPPADWRPYARRAERLGRPEVSLLAGGLPVTVPAREFTATAGGYEVRLPAGVEAASGPVCLTFHQYGPGMRWQENVVMVGAATAAGDRLSVTVERALPDWSLPSDRRGRSFLEHGSQLRRRLKAEAGRRSQPVPEVRRPA
ncbi:hemerythrin [Nonomuraea rubra]|uniref:Hemerythrin n=1 Tax=Nonomuraea rubra TaxID=46180 RepID=A0A7X0U1G9_9ACTN|nr:hemerythrin [Nonomuraea rubra]MBB6551747.1 hypothetical protein [Nonomuraea rubra]